MISSGTLCNPPKNKNFYAFCFEKIKNLLLSNSLHETEN